MNKIQLSKEAGGPDLPLHLKGQGDLMGNFQTRKAFSRFASVEDVMSGEFMDLITVFNRLTDHYRLPDHSDVNQARYPWSFPYLSEPRLYAARMWEYPFAILSAELQPGMTCADIGCGMTAFTPYLRDIASCEVVGVDPEIFEAGIRYKGHGVSKEYLERTALRVVQSGMESIALPSSSFDRVFCLSVIEHLPPAITRRGVQEMARILKPGGRLIMTVDVNMHSDITRPLDLIWESGLIPVGEMDLHWPKKRLGIFFDGRQPADVFGMTLTKEEYDVETEYSGDEASPAPTTPGNLVPTLRWNTRESTRPQSFLRSIAGRIVRAGRVLIHG